MTGLNIREDNVKITAVAEEVQGDEFESSLIYPGDQIMATVTHEISVGGEKSWVKFGASIAVRPGETQQHAEARLDAVVTEGSLREVESNVAAIRAFMAGKR